MEEIFVKNRRIYRFITTDFRTNTYIVTGDKNIIIDPGELTEEMEEILYSHQPLYVILTHGHFDHIGGVKWIKRKFKKVEVAIHERDKDMLLNPLLNLSIFTGRVIKSPSCDILLKEGDFEGMEILHTPGHTEGSVSILGNGFIFTGDTLFIESIGRTDIPGGSQKKLEKSIRRIRDMVPEDFLVLPGHGNFGTMEDVLHFNPFVE